MRVQSVKAQGFEGLVAKRRNSVYEPGLRTGAWTKMRVNRGQEFVIGGYTRGTKTFDALIFGYFERRSAEIGRPMRARGGREADLERSMVFAGGPEQVADRILHLHKLLGHSRQILQVDVGGMPHETFLKSIELLGKKVLPKVREQIETEIDESSK